jgi:hypothetical protein
MAVVSGIVIFGLMWFTLWFIRQWRGGGEDEGVRLAAQAKRNQTMDSFPQEKQTPKQREHWAFSQDLERDNQAIVQQKQAHNPMMREFAEHDAPSPRSTSPPLPAP